MFDRLWVKAIILCAGLFLAIAPYASARTIRASNFGQTVGLSIHKLKNVEAELDEIQAAGFKIIRVDTYWQYIEEQRGRYNFGYLDKVSEAASRRGLRLIIILNYSNPLYEEMIKKPGNKTDKGHPAAPRSPESIDAFVSFAKATVERYKKLDPIWEIWNEPDIGFWPPAPSVDQYLRLANATCRGIRQVDADAAVIAPGAATTPRWAALKPPFLETLFGSDLVDCLDAVSIHPYLPIDQMDWTPKLWDAMRTLRTEGTRKDSGKLPIAFVSSESGLSTYRRGITDETQASYIAKMFMLNAASDVPLSILYTWIDTGDDPTGPENRYGIMRRDGSPKPAYVAVKHMTAELKDTKFACRMEWPSAIGLVFQKHNDGSAVIATWPRPGLMEWAATTSNQVELQDVVGAKSATNLVGEAATMTEAKSGFSVGPGLPPFYLRIDSKAADICNK